MLSSICGWRPKFGCQDPLSVDPVLAPTKVISRTSRVAGTLRTEYSSTPTRRSRRRVYQRLLDFAFGDFYIAQSVHFAKVFGFDGYNLDGFGTSALCYCRYCQDAYKKDSGKLLPASRDVASIEFRRFMRWKLNRWTDFVCRWQKAINGWDEIIFRPLSGGRFAHQYQRADTIRVSECSFQS